MLRNPAKEDESASEVGSPIAENGTILNDPRSLINVAEINLEFSSGQRNGMIEVIDLTNDITSVQLGEKEAVMLLKEDTIDATTSLGKEDTSDIADEMDASTSSEKERSVDKMKIKKEGPKPKEIF